MSEFDTRPVTTENWNDFVALFEARGGPHYCWCRTYRFSGSKRLSKAEKKSSLQQLVMDFTPVGVLAYDGDQPVGWCSIAPRETYEKLERTRTMPRATPAETLTWTVLCFFVPNAHRGRHITYALLRGAISYARSKSAKVVEGYPFDSAGITATHRGHSKLFKASGFSQDGRRWYIEIDSA